MAFRPLNDNVLIRRLEVEEEQQGSIIIPDTAKEKPQEGQVLAVGPGKRQLGVAVDNKVLFGKYAGTEITIDGEELLVMRESDLLGVVE
ncbi:10 kDa chaperonin 5 [Geodia barretti]|uniref:20 kDa chaperonin, chloroplastic n=1 Tax=Geodia barretti TaxID=519541 RepID=A0AA35WVT6_GEOBA|nr:10 kDa chaperonin 5 [Geodia barretti]